MSVPVVKASPAAGAGAASDVEVREWEEFAISLALEAGQVMMSATARGVHRQTEAKASAVDLVTEADKGIEELLIRKIAQRFPHHRTIGEESSSSAPAASAGTTPADSSRLTDAVTWIIDPIDGTLNFVHTFPLSCVSIGVTCQRAIVLGVVFNPWLDQLFTARRGSGAYLNGKPIHASGCKDLTQALVIAELGGSREEARKDAVCRNAQAIMWKCHGLRSLGSAAMNTCSVACGSADVYYEFGLHAWDMCASALILTEAGGCVIDTKGGPLDLMNRRMIAAATPELALQVSNLLPVHLDLERD